MVLKNKMTVGNDENTPAVGGGASGSDGKFRGVRKRKWGKYVSEIRLPNSRERIWLGSYDAAEKAARAFDAATFCLRGRSAKFNFPDSPPEIPGGMSLSRPEIQDAAARYAENPVHRRETPARSLAGDASTTGSPSASVFSDGTVQLELDHRSDGGSYLDMLTTMGSGNYATDYGYFPAFDEFYSPEIPFADVENVDGAMTQSIFLWNF